MAKRVFELQGRLASSSGGFNLGPDLFNAIKTTQASREIQWTSALTLPPDSDQLTLEGWVYYENLAVTLWRSRNSGGGLQSSFTLETSGRWTASMDRANFATHYDTGNTSGAADIPAFTWIQMLVSSNLTSSVTPIVQVAFNGIEVPSAGWTLNIRNGGTLYSVTGANAVTSDAYLAVSGHTVARLWLGQQYYDLTDPDQIAKFIDVDSHYIPVQLGPDGSLPGVAPFIFMQNTLLSILANSGTERDADALDGTWSDSGHNPTSPAKFAHRTDVSPNQSGLEMTNTALGLVDTQQISLAFWFKTALATTAGELVICADNSASDKFLVSYDTSGIITVAAKNAAGTTILSGVSTGIDISTTTWQHVAISVNMQAATGADALRIAIDGTDATGSVSTFVGSESINLGQTGLIFAIFNHSGRTKATTGEFSQFWCAPGVFLDFSVAATVAKFVGAGPIPIELGVNGATPTGTAPIIYTGEGPTFIDGNPYHNVNLGSGGGTFTVSGNAWIAPVTHPPAQTFL